MQPTSSKINSFFEKAVQYILIGVAVLIPFFFIPQSFIPLSSGTNMLFLSGTILALLSAIGYFFTDPTKKLSKTPLPIILMFVAVPLVYILASLNKGFSSVSFFGFIFEEYSALSMIAFFVYTFLFTYFFREKKTLFYFYIAYVIALLVTFAFFAVRIALGVNILQFGIFTTLGSNIFGTFNNAAIFFGAGLLLSLHTLQSLKVHKAFKIMYSFIAIVALIALVVTNFSLIWYLLIALTVLYSAHMLYVRRQELPTLKEKVKALPLYYVAVAILSVIFLSFPTVSSYVAGKLQISSIEVRPSYATTVSIIKDTIKTTPLFGSGPHTFVNQWTFYRPSEVVPSMFWDIDFVYGVGFFPTLIVTTGIVGLASWLLFFACFIYLGFTTLRKKFEDPFTEYMYNSSFVIATYFWVLLWVYVPSMPLIIYTFIFTSIFLALYMIDMPQVQSANTMMYGAVATPSSRKLMLRRGVLGLITVLVIFVSYESVTVARSVWYFQKGASLLRTPENIEEGTKDVVKAATLRPHALYFRTLSQVYQVVFTNVLQQKVTDANKATIEKALNDSFAQAVAYATKARDLEPENYVNWIVLGQTYQLSVPLKITGAYESAQYAYTEALRRNPLNPRIGLLLASLEVDRGNLEGARSYVLQTISMKPNYLDAYAFLTQIEVNLKNLPGAIQSQTLVTQINPTDPNAFFQLGLLQYYSQDFKGATASFEKTLSLASDYANAKYYLGLTYELTGNRPKAIDMFVDLAKTNPDNQEVQAILKSLQAGISPFSQANQNLSDKKQTVPIKTNR